MSREKLPMPRRETSGPPEDPRRTSPRIRTVSVIIVNYHTASLVENAVASLRTQTSATLSLEIIVADNGSSPEERRRLGSLAGVRLLSFAANLGFAEANNRAARIARGEYLFFLNPDTWVFPGAVACLVDRLESDTGIGAVGPRIWWDRARTFQLPPTYPLSPSMETALVLAGRIPGLYRPVRSRWTRTALRFWTCSRPSAVPALSGAAFLTRSDTWERTGGFDANTFFMYFEDVDWCLRLRRAGLRIVCEPRAEAAHFVNQSGKRNPAETMKRLEASKERFFLKHYGSRFQKRLRKLKRLLDGIGLRPRTIPFTAMGETGPDTVFEASGNAGTGPFLFQLAVDPLMFPSAGMLCTVPRARIGREVWQWLGSGTYFSTLTDTSNRRVVGAWTWWKS